MEVNKKRIEWVDIAKAMCMICVIASHSSYCNEYFGIFFNPFFLSLFFFLSGYVYKDNCTFKELVVKKAKGILIPWFVFGILNIAMKQIISFNEHVDFIIELRGMFLQIRGKMDIEWFLVCLFMSFIPYYFLINKLDKKNSIVISGVLATLSMLYVKYVKINVLGFNTNALPWHLQTIFVADFLMVLGYYYKKEYEEKLKINSKQLVILIEIYVYLIITCYLLFKTTPSINVYNMPILGWYIITILSILIEIEICKRIKNRKVYSFIGSNTLLIFCLHGKCQSITEKLFKILNFDMFFKFNVLGNFIGTSVSVLIILGLLIVPIIIINKFFPFLLGKSNKNGKLLKEKK